MTENIQNTSQPEMPRSTNVQGDSKLRNIAITVVVIVFVSIFSSVVTYLFLQSGKTNIPIDVGVNNIEVTTLIPTQSTPEVVVETTSIQEKWQLFEYTNPTETTYYKNFRFYYPNDWVVTARPQDGNSQSMRFRIEKKDASVEIMHVQGASSCLYPEDVEKMGMYTRYGKYKEFDKGNLKWRRATPDSQEENKMQAICELDSNGQYQELTSIGVISYKDEENDQMLLQEFDEMLERVEVVGY